MNRESTTTGRSAFLALLKDEGVTHLFGNPGTTELPIMHALAEHPDLTYVLGLHESVVVAMADGFSRASGKLVACNVHVAPGLGNALGSLYNSKITGTPMILTAGQQELGHGLTEPMLYDSLVPMAEPLVKWAVEVHRVEDLPRIVRRAAKVALTPPTGPVFISLPGDILNRTAVLDLGSPTRVDAAGRPSDGTLERLADRLLAAERPLIVSGHEVATSDALDEVARFAEILGAPAWQQTVASGAHFYSEHPAYMGGLERAQARVREILAPHDLLVFVGADVLKMSVWSELDALPAGMPVVQIGQRDWEMGKNYPAEMAVRSDVREALLALNPLLEEKGGEAQRSKAGRAIDRLAESNWAAERERARTVAMAKAESRPLDAATVMMHLAEAVPEDGIVVDEGLTSTNTLRSFLPYRDRRSYFGMVSGGIGWGVAGAVGVQLAQPDRPVLAVSGDGSAMYSIQALWTAVHHDLPLTYLICDNGGYRILKQRLLSFHGSDRYVGMDFEDPPIDFLGLAESLGMPARRITEADEVGPAVREAMASGRPSLLNVVVDGRV